jgi:hypothetical protein
LAELANDPLSCPRSRDHLGDRLLGFCHLRGLKVFCFHNGTPCVETRELKTMTKGSHISVASVIYLPNKCY